MATTGQPLFPRILQPGKAPDRCFLLLTTNRFAIDLRPASAGIFLCLAAETGGHAVTKVLLTSCRTDIVFCARAKLKQKPRPGVWAGLSLPDGRGGDGVS